MKKYTSCATKWLLTAALICFAALFVGIILIITKNQDVALQILFIALGGLMGILFLSCFFAEKSRALVIDNEKIVFPRGADKNGKIVFEKTGVKFEEILSLESKIFKGDGLISKSTFFYTLTLKDGTKITVKLYAYGEDAEKEIVEIISSHISQNKI